jgi:hypothetical protein
MKFIHLEKVFQNHFEIMLKLHSTFKTLIFEILSLMLIINFPKSFRNYVEVTFNI